jgi:hypothetical protein
MLAAVTAIIGAVIGAIATVAAVTVQSRLSSQADARRRQETRDSDRERQRMELARHYLFQLRDAVVSLQKRLENWAHHGGQPWAESIDPGYWDITTLYALGRALAAERVLILEGANAAIAEQFPALGESMQNSSVEQIVRTSLRRLFYYHRLALAESLLDQRQEGYRLLMYTEWRRRYEDPSSGLDRLLEPTMTSLEALSPEKDLDRLIKSLDGIASELGTALSRLLAAPITESAFTAHADLSWGTRRPEERTLACRISARRRRS